MELGKLDIHTYQEGKKFLTLTLYKKINSNGLKNVHVGSETWRWLGKNRELQFLHLWVK